MSSSTLTQDWAPGLISPGAQAFVNGPEDLEMVGVQYAPEQLDLLERGSVFRPGQTRLYALAVTALPDPVFPHSEALGLTALTLDEEDNLDPVLVPTVVEIDCSEWETFDEQEPDWRRFPSLLGRALVISPAVGDWSLDGLRPFRLWDCWPLGAYGQGQFDAALIQHAVQDWRNTHWAPYLQWLEVRDNIDVDPCDFEGTPEHLHDHGPDADGRHRGCRTEDNWFTQYGRLQMAYDNDGDPYPRPFPPVDGLFHLAPVWEQLLATSRTNAHAALMSYPEWELEPVIRTERHYSPWLSSF